MAALGLTVGLLAGCGSSAVGGVPRAATAAPTTISLYASVPKETLDAEIAAFGQADPQVRVTVFRNGTGPVTARVESELRAGHIGADVVWLAEPTAIAAWAGRGLLVDWTPPEAGSLIQAGRGPAYWPTRVINVILAYHRGMAAPAPSDWNDLGSAAYRGRVGLPNPAYAGSTLAALGYFLGRPEYGLPFYQRLAANGAVQLQGNQEVADGIAQGRFDVGMTLDYMVNPMAARGSPIVAVWPRSGAIAVPSPIAIFAGGPHQVAAKAFVAFVLSRAGQQLLVRQGFQPARTDLPGPADTAGPVVEPDWQRLESGKAGLLAAYRGVFAE